VEKVRSKDGTTIAFDRLGDGAVVIVLGGATCDRAMTLPLAEQLASRFTVINYDRRGRGDSSRGGTIPVDLIGGVTLPTLVLCGGASPTWMIHTTRRVADAMPNGRHRVLEGQEHVVAPELLAPVLAEFFTDWNYARHRTESRKEPT
jgi:pimeloyl-ACP methyl ester carboxylesterase